MSLSPSFRGFRFSDFLFKILVWRNDLNQFFKDLTGLEPRPFQSEFFEDVQKLESKNIVIVAGRGIGKTLALAVVALWYVLVLSVTEQRPFKVIILAGSLDQAKICFNYIMEIINSSEFLQKQLAKEPTQREIIFKDGSWIRPLPASEKSIRGHHPDLLIIDEAAQVEDDIIYAALPMTATSPYSRHIFSTTPTTGYSWIEEKWEHQANYPAPYWKFFNWNAESFLSKDQIEDLKRKLPPDRYCSEIQGLPYKREGKVFRLEDLKKCIEDWQIPEKPGYTYAGIDWGYFPAPTALVIVKQVEDMWYVLHTSSYLAESFEEVHRKIKEICESYNVSQIFTDSTDKGENLRLAATGLPVVPISFKAEKSSMIANLRMLVEQHRIKLDPMTQQGLLQQMLDYVYDSKRNDDYVDALMLAVRANPLAPAKTYSLEDYFREMIVTRKEATTEDKDRNAQIKGVFREMGRIDNE